MDFLKSFLPPDEGLLPKWFLFVGVVALGNTLQTYSTLHYSQRLYNGPAPTANSHPPSKPRSSSSATPPPMLSSTSPVTPLSSRTFGTWTALQGIVRIYAAYHVRSRPIYALAFWTYLVAAGHFLSEWLVFRSARWNRALAAPVFISSGTLVWMLLQWDAYVG